MGRADAGGGLALPLELCGRKATPLAAGLVVAGVGDVLVVVMRSGSVGGWSGQRPTTPSPHLWGGRWLSRAADAPLAAGGPAHISKPFTSGRL